MDPLDGQDVYAAEKILKSRTRKGKTEYLIKWKGWSNQHNTWEPSSNILNENLFTESGFPVPSGFKGGNRRGARRSNRGRKRKIKEISDSDDSEDDIQSYEDEAMSESHSDDASEISPRTGTHSRPGTSVAVTEEEPIMETVKPSTVKVRKRGPKSRKTLNDIPTNSDPVSKSNETKKEEDKKIEEKVLKEEKSDEEKVLEEAAEATCQEELEKEKNVEYADTDSETKLNSSDANDVEGTECAPSEVEIFRKVEGDEITTVKEKSVQPEVEVRFKKPEVFEGRSGSMQVISNGQEQMINRLAFVVDGTPDSSRRSEQLQLHEYGDNDESQIRLIADQLKNETKIWTDANNARFESFQYNGGHTITEVTVNQHTVPIIEL